MTSKKYIKLVDWFELFLVFYAHNLCHRNYIKIYFFLNSPKKKTNLQVVSAASGREMLKTQNGEHGEQVERSLSRFQLYYT